MSDTPQLIDRIARKWHYSGTPYRLAKHVVAVYTTARFSCRMPVLQALAHTIRRLPACVKSERNKRRFIAQVMSDYKTGNQGPKV